MKHIIAHYEDLDGLACHVIAERAFPTNISHHNISYAMQAKPFQNIPTGNHILFCDLGFSKNTIPMLEEIKRHNAEGSTVDFYDHHVWDEKIIQNHFNNINHNTKKSSGQLLQEDILPNDEFSKHIAKLAYLDDREEFTTQTQELSDIIKSAYPFQKLIHDLAYTTKITSEAKIAMKTYREEKSIAIDNMQKTYETHNINGTKVITALADNMLYMKQGYRQMKKDNPDALLLCLYENTNSIIFQLNDKYFPIITSKLNAGGRNNKGGIHNPEIITTQNYQNIIKNILEVIQ